MNYYTINVNMEGDIYGEPKRQFVAPVRLLCQGSSGGMQPRKLRASAAEAALPEISRYTRTVMKSLTVAVLAALFLFLASRESFAQNAPDSSFPQTAPVKDDFLYLIKSMGGGTYASRTTTIASMDDNIRHASRFSGANAGAKILAAIADLPATGGIVDARGFEGNQDITSNICSRMSNTRQVTLLLGHANFRTTVTQTCTSAAGLRIMGESTSGAFVLSSGSGTRFTWNGSNGGTVFLLNYVADSYFGHFSIVPGTGTIGIGIRIDQVNGPPGPPGFTLSTHDIFENISIYQAKTGVQIGNDSLNSNDLHEFHNVEIIGPGTYGYYINNAQTKFIKIHGGNVTDQTHGIYDVRGSFQAENCNFANNTNDISLGTPADAILIKACQSEGAKKFLKAFGPSGVSYPVPVTLMSNRASTNNVGADNIYLQYYAAGPLVLINNIFTDGRAKPSVKTDFQAAGGLRVVSIGNLWWDKDAFFGTPNDVQRDLVSLGDVAVTGIGDSVQMPNLLGDTPNFGGFTVLSNGNNNDIPTVGISTHYTLNYFKITGPTGAFNISGFSDGRPGRTIQVFNSTAQQMTIKNLAGSIAANQIQTLTGADVVLRTGTSFASFLYDATLQKWILTSSN